jgi:acyl carrier protein
MPDSRTLEPLISRLFAEKLNVDVPSVETDLIETGLVDSLIFVEFLAQLEEGFGIHLSLEDLEIDRFRTIARIASFVATKNGKSGNGAGVSLRE